MGLLALAAEVRRSGFRRLRPEIWPRLFVFAVGMIVGGLVAAAAHSQMRTSLPAFFMGAGAPSVIRDALRRVEVSERKPGEAPDELDEGGAP